jgi:hypothetical protein
MRRQKCTKCGTMLDVTKLEKGAKFACATCGAVLVVGEAPVTKRSFKESGPAFTPKGKSEAPPPAPTRPARRRAAEDEPRPGGEAAPKSRLPLFAGIGAAVVAVVVIAIVVSGGGGGGSGGAGGPSPAEWWATKNVGGASAEQLRQWLKEGRERGYDRDPAFWGPKEDLLLKEILRKDAKDPIANERAGNKSLDSYPDFRNVWAQVDESFQQLPREMQDYFESLEVEPDKQVWLTPARFAEVSGKLDEFVAWRAQRDENPSAEAAEKGVARVKERLSTAQRKIGVAPVAEPPFLLLLVYEENADADASRGRLVAEGKRWAAALKLVREQFDQRIREPLGLAPVEAGKYYYDVVVPTQEDFARLLHGEEGGYDKEGDIPAFFSMRTKWAQLRAPIEANDKALFGGDLAHAAVHQLQWHYSADPKDKFQPNYMEEWTGIWLTEGLAEYLGAGVDLDPGTGKATFSGKPPRRVEFLQAMTDNGVPLIPVRELIQLTSLDAFARYVNGTWLPGMRTNEDIPEAASQWASVQQPLVQKVLYAQSWLLVHFLYEADDGKYRAKLLDLVLTALRGRQKPERYRTNPSQPERFKGADDAFVEIMGLKDGAAWNELQKEHDRHRKRLLRGE